MSKIRFFSCVLLTFFLLIPFAFSQENSSIEQVALNKAGPTGEYLYQLRLSYENSKFDNRNSLIGPESEKVNTKGANLEFHLERDLNTLLSTSSIASFSYGTQNRHNDQVHDSSIIRNYSLRFGQSLNLNIHDRSVTYQPFISAGLGAGMVTEKYGPSSTRAAGFLFEGTLGINLKLPSGLVPFAKISYLGLKSKSLRQKDELTSNRVQTTTTDLNSKDSNYGSVITALGIGYIF